MKHLPVTLAILFAAILSAITGCTENVVGSEGGNPSNNPTHTTPANTPFAIARSATTTREISLDDDGILTEQAASNNAFALALYSRLTTAEENLFFSPYSISAALAMTAAGGAGSTKQQIRDALQVTLDGDDFDAAINGLDLSLTSHSETTDGITLHVVNSSWMQSGWNFRLNYLDHLSRYYGAGVNLLDFANEPDESRIIINTWIADQTNRKITDLLGDGTITPATVLVLTNAIYFLADWLTSFNPEYTREGSFSLPDESIVRPQMMYYDQPGNTVTMKYARLGKTRALDIPYKGDRLTMTVLLPDAGEFAAFESTVSIDTINNLIDALDSAELPVSLPKFEFTFGSASLKEPLKILGMTDAFDGGNADFSGIDGSHLLFVDDVLHKAFIAVDEAGTEAAAATAVTITYESVDPDKAEFNVNRPFIFLIRDKTTGVILFMGRIVNPTLSE